MSKLQLCALLTLFAGCSVDERALTYGQGIGSASGHGNQGSEAGAGGEADMSDGGSEATEPGSGGAPAEGGAPEGGAPAEGGTMGATANNGGSSMAGAGGATGGSSSVSGASGTGGTGGGGGNATAGTSGTGGGGAGGIDPDAGPCGDINRNAVQDCDETLVENADFVTTADDWAVEQGATQAWRAEDARGHSGSGSVAIVNTKVGSGEGWTSAGSGQCLVAKSGQVFELGARAFIPAGQAQGYVRVGLIIYGNDDCQGTVLASVTTGTLAEAGAWQPLSGKTKLPAGTRSIYVRLIAEKPVSAAAFEVRFDDVLVRKD